MKTTESCSMCERVAVMIETTKPLESIAGLPTTQKNGKGTGTGWRKYDIMAYALVPRCVNGAVGIVDLYLCLEEDDLDDIDLAEYAEHFLKTKIFPQMDNFKEAHILPPSLSTPIDIGCWRLHHESHEIDD